MRRCPRCGETKPVTAFWRDRRTASGYAVYCIGCGTQRNAEKYRAKAAREGRTTRPWRPLREEFPAGHRRCQRCQQVLPEVEFVTANGKAAKIGSYCLVCNIANSNESRERRHGSGSNYHLKRRYGITAEDRRAMQEAQGGVCLICRTQPAAHVDHDHATGAIRGMLCFNCNGGLGQFKDNVALLEQAVRYLRGELRPSYLDPPADAAENPRSPDQPDAPD
jgi:hypothetical protein